MYNFQHNNHIIYLYSIPLQQRNCKRFVIKNRTIVFDSYCSVEANKPSWKGA